MAASDQPSILTVCVPAGKSERATLDLNDIHAAREQAISRAAAHLGSTEAGSLAGGALANSQAGDPTRSRADALESNAPAAKCDACDDSACGMEVGGNAAHACRSGPPGAGGSECQRTGPCAKTGAKTGAKTVGEVDSPSLCQPSFFHADSGKNALELLRMLRFDLLVTGDRLPDMPVGQLIRRVRVAWPWQKWAMVGSMITTQDEIAARTLGAMAVFDAPPDWEVLGALASIAAGSTRETRSGSANAETARLQRSILENGADAAGAGTSAVRRPMGRSRGTRSSVSLPPQRISDRAAG